MKLDDFKKYEEFSLTTFTNYDGHDNYAAFQYGLDSYHENWAQEKINTFVVDCIDPAYFYAGRDCAAEQDIIE